ncbi:MAG: phytase, partial [Shewanella sp.]
MTKPLMYFREHYSSIIQKITLTLLGVMGIHASSLAQTPYSIAAHKGSQAQPLVFGANGNTAPTAPQNPNTPAWLWVSEKQGLMLQTLPTADNTPMPAATTLVKGEFELLAFSDPYALTLDRRADRIRPIMIKQIKGNVATNMLPLLPMTSFEINWICIQPRPQDGN